MAFEHLVIFLFHAGLSYSLSAFKQFKEEKFQQIFRRIIDSSKNWYDSEKYSKIEVIVGWVPSNAYLVEIFDLKRSRV